MQKITDKIDVFVRVVDLSLNRGVGKMLGTQKKMINSDQSVVHSKERQKEFWRTNKKSP